MVLYGWGNPPFSPFKIMWYLKVTQIISVESWDKNKRPFPAFWAVSSICWVADSDHHLSPFHKISLTLTLGGSSQTRNITSACTTPFSPKKTNKANKGKKNWPSNKKLMFMKVLLQGYREGCRIVPNLNLLVTVGRIMIQITLRFFDLKKKSDFF